jgi:tetratricopeptide (TPR) repeat protein
MKRLFTIFFVFSPLLLFAQKQGQAFIDSVLKELPRAKEDTNKVKMLHRLAFGYQNINPDEGIKYALQELDLATKLEWKKGIGLAYNCLGVNYDAKSDFDKALDYHFSALKVNEEIENKKEIARSLENIAFTCQDKGDHPKALEYNFRALKIFEEINDKEGIAGTSGAIGSVYQSEENYDKALEYHFNALKIHKEQGNKVGVAGNMGNIGIVYEHQNNYDKALEYDIMALRLYNDLGDKHGKERNLGNIGNIYAGLKDYGKAMEYDFQALDVAKELGDKNIIGANLGNIGETYLLIVKDMRTPKPDDHISGIRETNLERSIEYLNKGIAVCKEIGLLDAIVEFTQSLSEAYTLSGDTKSALENYKVYAKLKDSIFSDENKMKVKRMGDKYEVELKDRDAQIAMLTATKKRNEHLLFIGGVCVVALVIGIVLRNIYSQK